MKKTVAMLLIILCLGALILTACTDGKKGEENTTAVTTEAPGADATQSGEADPAKDTVEEPEEETTEDPLYNENDWSKRY